LVKAAIFLVMGRIVADVMPIIGTVGYITALIYLFCALAYVPHFTRWKSPEDAKNQYSDLQAERKNKAEG